MKKLQNANNMKYKKEQEKKNERESKFIIIQNEFGVSYNQYACDVYIETVGTLKNKIASYLASVHLGIVSGNIELFYYGIAKMTMSLFQPFFWRMEEQ